MMPSRKHTRMNFDPASNSNNTYSDYSGGVKISDVGHRLIPIPTADGVGTTNASSAINVGKGVSLAIYNNAGAAASVTTGPSSVTSLAIGVSVAAATPQIAQSVGIPCKPNDWTYINTYDHTHVVTSAATLLVYIIQDDTAVS